VVFGHCIQLNPNTVIVDAPINWRWIHSQPINKDLNQPIKVVYSTSREDDRLWEIFWPAVHRVILKFGAKVEFYFWGQAPAQLLNEKGVHRIPLVKNYNRFLQLFSARMFDIGLAPLPDDAFHRSKTNNKFREYSACGIAGIYSQMDVYRRCVNHRKNGLLVNNDAEAWYQALCELVENVELRRSIQIEARTYAQEHYSQVEFDRVWYNQIVSLVKKQSQNLITSQPKAATLESGPEKHFSKRASLIQLIKKLFHRLLTLPEESSESLVFFLRWALFNAWSLLKVNLLKRL
jgi:glycosyltransferase involved in cell wall biosynthesis